MYYNEHKTLLTILRAYVELNPHRLPYHEKFIDTLSNIKPMCVDCGEDFVCDYHYFTENSSYSALMGDSKPEKITEVKLGLIPSDSTVLLQVKEFFEKKFGLEIYSLDNLDICFVPFEKVSSSVCIALDNLFELSYEQLLLQPDKEQKKMLKSLLTILTSDKSEHYYFTEGLKTISRLRLEHDRSSETIEPEREKILPIYNRYFTMMDLVKDKFVNPPVATIQ